MAEMMVQVPKILELLYFSRSTFILLGVTREHRNNVSVLPICLNKETMGWRSLTKGRWFLSLIVNRPRACFLRSCKLVSCCPQTQGRPGRIVRFRSLLGRELGKGYQQEP